MSPDDAMKDHAKTRDDASFILEKKIKKNLEEPGIEPGAFHMQSERATTALHPLLYFITNNSKVFYTEK